MEYDPTQFRGAARFYRLGRAPYSASLGAVLARELGLDGTGHLLDAGAGPGTLGLSLATAESLPTTGRVHRSLHTLRPSSVSLD